MAKPAVVFDCNIYLQTMISPNGPSGRCVALASGGQFVLWTSSYISREVKRVAKRAEIVAKYPQLTPEQVESVLLTVGGSSRIRKRIRKSFHFDRDPDDAHYVDLAVATKAQWLVTRDRDLLDLMVGHSADAKQFRQVTRNQLKVVSPTDFLAVFDVGE
jgi:putative PIN family toxin of toxin-antitoxin system